MSLAGRWPAPVTAWAITKPRSSRPHHQPLQNVQDNVQVCRHSIPELPCRCRAWRHHAMLCCDDKLRVVSPYNTPCNGLHPAKNATLDTASTDLSTASCAALAALRLAASDHSGVNAFGGPLDHPDKRIQVQGVMVYEEEVRRSSRGRPLCRWGPFPSVPLSQPTGPADSCKRAWRSHY
jgi:hypothetical protein